MRSRPVFLALALAAATSCTHLDHTPTIAPAMPAMFEVEVANVSDAAPASSLCAAAAAERDAHWPGLFWTRRPGGPSTCVLTANTPNMLQPIIHSSNCAMSEGPFECIVVQPMPVPAEGGHGYESLGQNWFTSNETPVALRDRPDATSAAIGQIAPRSSLVILDFEYITYFSHSGTLRASYPQWNLSAGQVVVPTYGATTTPWIDGPRYDEHRATFDIMTWPQQSFYLPRGPTPRLDIAWEELPAPSQPRQFWVLVQLLDGSIGWSEFAELGIDLGLEDE